MMRTVCSSEVLVFSMFAPLKFLEITRFDLDYFLSIVIPIFIRFSMQSSCSVRVKVKENFHRNNPTLIPSKGKVRNFIFTLLKSEKSITSSEKSTVYSQNSYNPHGIGVEQNVLEPDMWTHKTLQAYNLHILQHSLFLQRFDLIFIYAHTTP